jgi:hypothetical protein
MSDPHDKLPEDAAAKRYRSAVETVDERPSAATRAAILAAAARQVGAQPRAANALPGQRVRRRWPLAAAAAVMLSTLAVLLAVRTEREMPSFTEPSPDSSNRVTQEIAPPAPPPIAAPAASDAMRDLAASAEAERAGKPETPAARRAATAERGVDDARSPMAKRSAEDAASDRSKQIHAGTERSNAERTERPAPDAVDAQAKLSKETGSAETPAPAQKATQAAASGAREQLPRSEAAVPAPALGGAAGSAPRESDASMRRDESARQRAVDAPAAAAPMKPAAGGLEGKVELSAAEWLKKIIDLRAQGRDEEADRELRKFKERYPEIVPPAEALSKAATR